MGNRNRSRGEEGLSWQLYAAGIPYETEYRFHPVRKWRADFKVGDDVLIEVEGLTAQGGRHQRTAGYTNDCEKYNEATLLGYRVLRVTPAHVHNGMALQWVEKLLGTHQTA